MQQGNPDHAWEVWPGPISTANLECTVSPSPLPAPSLWPAGSCPYVVREGDTFLKVSRKPANPIPVDSIIALNPGVNPEALKVGQTIQVPCNGGGSTTKPGKPAPGTVPPGNNQQQFIAGNTSRSLTPCSITASEAIGRQQCQHNAAG